MEYKEVYESYKQEHPDELAGLNALKAKSDAIEFQRHKERREKLEYIEQCRRALYG